MNLEMDDTFIKLDGSGTHAYMRIAFLIRHRMRSSRHRLARRNTKEAHSFHYSFSQPSRRSLSCFCCIMIKLTTRVRSHFPPSERGGMLRWRCARTTDLARPSGFRPYTHRDGVTESDPIWWLSRNLSPPCRKTDPLPRGLSSDFVESPLGIGAWWGGQLNFMLRLSFMHVSVERDVR